MELQKKSIVLQWKEFLVDLPSIESWVKSNFPLSGYIGNSADSSLTLWFNQDASAIPTDEINEKWDSLTLDSSEVTAYANRVAASAYQRQAAAAIAYGQTMMAQFAGENLQLGITAAGKTKVVRLAMQEVTNCLTTGSLIEAIDEIKAISPANYDLTFITADRLLTACNQLEAFCGLPLSTSLT
jgi:hypothetical protein